MRLHLGVSVSSKGVGTISKAGWIDNSDEALTLLSSAYIADEEDTPFVVVEVTRSVGDSEIRYGACKSIYDVINLYNRAAVYFTYSFSDLLIHRVNDANLPSVPVVQDVG